MTLLSQLLSLIINGLANLAICLLGSLIFKMPLNDVVLYFTFFNVLNNAMNFRNLVQAIDYRRSQRGDN